MDRLLASEHFGEHWARMWLDLARYADTKGYEKDQARSIWRCRDWVIDAFDTDMPYDQFTREQLAGDLLPNATESQILAMESKLSTLREAFWAKSPAQAEGQAAWGRKIAAPNPWTPLKFISGAGIGGSSLTARENGSIAVSGVFPEAETNVIHVAAPNELLSAMRIELLNDEGVKGPGRNSADRNVVVSELIVAWEKRDGAIEPVKLKNAPADFSIRR